MDSAFINKIETMRLAFLASRYIHDCDMTLDDWCFLESEVARELRYIRNVLRYNGLRVQNQTIINANPINPN